MQTPRTGGYWFLVGLILGNVKEGLIIGAQLELIWMGTASIGPTAGLSIGTGGTIGTAVAFVDGSGIEVAISCSVPVSILMQFYKPWWIQLIPDRCTPLTN